MTFCFWSPSILQVSYLISVNIPCSKENNNKHKILYFSGYFLRKTMANEIEILYCFFSLILIFSGVYLFGLMKNCKSNPNLLQGCNLDISSRSILNCLLFKYIASRRCRDSGLASSGDRKRMHPGCY